MLSMILAIATCPAMLGTQEAIRQSQQKNRREEHRAQRCNMTVTCVKSSLRSYEINYRAVVLRNNKLYVNTTGSGKGDDRAGEAGVPEPHAFCGYFLPYPDSEYEGLVSTITDVAPILNWIYVDKDTHEVKYGVRDFAQPNLTGPFDCTRQDRRMTFEGWEGFVAVEEHPGVWALYFDRDDNGLKGRIPEGSRVLEIELTRREKRKTKPEPEPDPDPPAPDATKSEPSPEGGQKESDREVENTGQAAAESSPEKEAKTEGQ